MIIIYSEYCITFVDNYSKSCIEMAYAAVESSIIIQM
jgi:hypothetical protein